MDTIDYKLKPKVTTTIDKYIELVQSMGDGYGVEIGKFSQIYKCSAIPTSNNKVELYFDNKEDMAWFMLKWL